MYVWPHLSRFIAILYDHIFLCKHSTLYMIFMMILMGKDHQVNKKNYNYMYMYVHVWCCIPCQVLDIVISNKNRPSRVNIEIYNDVI